MRTADALGQLERSPARPATTNQITENIIGAAIRVHQIRVHQQLGPGLLESAYEACVAYELGAVGIHVERQKPVPLVYRGVKLDCGFRADMLVEGRWSSNSSARKPCTPWITLKCCRTCDFLTYRWGFLLTFTS